MQRTILVALLKMPYINELILSCCRKRFVANSNVWGGKGMTMQHLIDESVNIFMPETERADKNLVKKITDDIIKCYYLYGSTPQEYFLFGFRNLPTGRRSEFLTNQHKDRVMIEKVGMGDAWDMLENKVLFHKKFSEFFRRDVCYVTEAGDCESFLEFCKKHDSFIAKPLNGQCGAGVKIVKATGSSAEKEFNELFASGKWIIEELIRQSPEMSVWNSSSVNTVRIPSFMNSRGFFILKPFLRSGRSGSIVDNANRGGIFSVIDEQTGKLCTNGFDLYGKEYAMHPDSGIQFLGWQVPEWESLVEFIRTVHSTVPDYPYIGWDYALSENGWVLIEGNWGQFDSETADREGIKRKFDSLFD